MGALTKLRVRDDEAAAAAGASWEEEDEDEEVGDLSQGYQKIF